MRTAVDVEAVMRALLLLLQEANIDPPIQTITRVWQPWDQLDKLAQPAIVIVEPMETETERRGQQSSVTLDVQLLLYARGDNQNSLKPPVSVLNDIIRGIRTALLPSGSGISQNVQTLGGLVSNCAIQGKIRKDAGVLDEQMSAIIPLTILVPA